MTDKEKKVIFSIIGIMLLILLVVVAVKGFGGNKNKPNTNINNNGTSNVAKDNKEEFVEKMDNGIKFNTSEELNKTKMYKNIEISNIKFVSKDNQSTLIANMKNIGSIVTNAEMVKMKLVGNNNEVLTEFDVYIGAIKPGETKPLTVQLLEDIVNAKDLVILPKN